MRLDEVKSGDQLIAMTPIGAGRYRSRQFTVSKRTPKRVFDHLGRAFTLDGVAVDPNVFIELHLITDDGEENHV